MEKFRDVFYIILIVLEIFLIIIDITLKAYLGAILAGFFIIWLIWVWKFFKRDV